MTIELSVGDKIKISGYRNIMGSGHSAKYDFGNGRGNGRETDFMASTCGLYFGRSKLKKLYNTIAIW